MNEKVRLPRQVYAAVLELCNQAGLVVTYMELAEGSTPAQQRAHERQMKRLGDQVRQVRKWLWYGVEVSK